MSLKLRTLVLGLLLSFCSLAVAQDARNLTAVGFTPQEATALTSEFLAKNATTSSVLKVRSDINRLFTWDASSDTALKQTFGDGGTTAAQNLVISGSTADADDDSNVTLTGGGALGSTRGAYFQAYGNEASSPGVANIGSGGTGDIQFISADDTIFYSGGNATWSVEDNGVLQSNGTNGQGVSLLQTGANLTPIVSGTTYTIDTDLSAIVGTHSGLVVNQNRTVSDSGVFIANAADTLAGVLTFGKTRATAPAINADTIVASGDELGALRFLGADGAAYRQAALIKITVDGTPGSSDMPGAIDFQVSPDGSATVASALKISNTKAAVFGGALTSTATGALGWTVVNAANQACNTTCTSACVIGIDTLGTGGFLDCATATADSCLCAGAS